jgi:hypothetical protein
MRTSINVDKETLVEAVQEAEANGPLSNLFALWKKIAEIYNNNISGDFSKISHSVVMLRVTEWEIPYVTKAGRIQKSKETSPETAQMRQELKDIFTKHAIPFSTSPNGAISYHHRNLLELLKKLDKNT